MRTRLDVKARTPGAGTGGNASDRRITILTFLLEHIDGSSAGRINSLAPCIEPQIIHAEHARQLNHYSAGVGIDNHELARLERGREQPAADFVECQCVAVGEAGDFPLLYGAVRTIDD